MPRAMTASIASGRPVRFSLAFGGSSPTWAMMTSTSRFFGNGTSPVSIS
jgi:hypothetical protein